MNPEQYPQFKKAIMRRVYRAYIIKQVTEPLIIESVIFAGIVFAVVSVVSIKDVIHNAWASHNVSEFSYFWLGAISHAHMPVKMLALAATITVGFMTYSVTKKLNGGYLTSFS